VKKRGDRLSRQQPDASYPCSHNPCCNACYFSSEDQREFEDFVAKIISILKVETSKLLEATVFCKRWSDCVTRLRHFSSSPYYLVLVDKVVSDDRKETSLISIDWKAVHQMSRRYKAQEKYFLSMKESRHKNIFERFPSLRGKRREESGRDACPRTCSSFKINRGIIDENRLFPTLISEDLVVDESSQNPFNESSDNIHAIVPKSVLRHQTRSSEKKESTRYVDWERYLPEYRSPKIPSQRSGSRGGSQMTGSLQSIGEESKFIIPRQQTGYHGPIIPQKTGDVQDAPILHHNVTGNSVNSNRSRRSNTSNQRSSSRNYVDRSDNSRHPHPLSDEDVVDIAMKWATICYFRESFGDEQLQSLINGVLHETREHGEIIKYCESVKDHLRMIKKNDGIIVDNQDSSKEHDRVIMNKTGMTVGGTVIETPPWLVR